MVTRQEPSDAPSGFFEVLEFYVACGDSCTFGFELVCQTVVVITNDRDYLSDRVKWLSFVEIRDPRSRQLPNAFDL
jgi:hypothetical protein